MLTLSEVSKTYAGGVRALDAVSLEIPKGMFGLLGPNGAGKSTLMRTIATLQDPDRGSITLDGLDVLRAKMELRKRLGYLPQEFGAYPRTSPEVMLDHSPCCGSTARSADQVIRLCARIWDCASAASMFSGGAAALRRGAALIATEPHHRDEPTAA